MSRIVTWLAFIVLAIAGWKACSQRTVQHAPGQVAPDVPVQTSASSSRPIALGAYTLQPLADFKITARVLSSESYSSDRESDLSPIDFALGWGPMSDSAVLDKIDISQNGRFFFWHVDTFPIPREEIETHASNMHMVPANSEVSAALKHVRVGQRVSIKGYLIEATAPDGWHWRSSLSRSDTGAGACELVYVESISVN